MVLEIQRIGSLEYFLIKYFYLHQLNLECLIPLRLVTALILPKICNFPFYALDETFEGCCGIDIIELLSQKLHFGIQWNSNEFVILLKICQRIANVYVCQCGFYEHNSFV